MEENNGEELTFKKVWQYIKKSGVRIIIYALVALIVCGGILGICDIFVSESQYETSITFYYSGVEYGNDPWGGQDNVISEIKSVSNVSSALEKLQYSDEEKDALVGLIIRNLNVIASAGNDVVDEDGVALSGNYGFRIVLSHDSAIDNYLKSRNDYNNLLSEITSNYIENFKNKYAISTSLSELAALDSYNSFQKYDALRGYINTFKEETNTWAEKAPDFISASQNMSFATLSSRIEIASLKLENYLSFILMKGISINEETQFIDLKLKESNDTIAIYDEEIKSLNDVLSMIMQNGEVNLPSSGTIIVNPPNPTEVTKAITEAISNKTIAQTEKNLWETRQSYFNTSNFESKSEDEKNALIADATKLELEVLNEYNAMLASYKSMIEDYNSGYNVSSLVRMTSSPRQVTTSPITMKKGLIIELMVLIIAIIIAMIVTNRKGAMVFRKKSDETDAVDIDEENSGSQDLTAQDMDSSDAVDEKQSDVSLQDEE